LFTCKHWGSVSTKLREEATGHCSATARSTGKPCKRPPGPGAVVCKVHGGALPRVRQAAQFRLARDEAQQELIKRMKTAQREDRADAVTELDRLAAEVIVFKDIVRERLDTIMALPEGIRYEGKTGEQLRAEVALYERALDRCNTVLATNVKLGIAERKVELNKAQAQILAGVIRAILGQLELNHDQQRMAARVVPIELMAISAAVDEA
jgi:hypothetical protein